MRFAIRLRQRFGGVSAEGEGERLHASIEELDLELSIDDRLRLSDQLIQIPERTDDLELLDDGSRPTVRDDHRKRIHVTRTDVDEVNVQPIDGGELRQSIQLRCVCRRPHNGRNRVMESRGIVSIAAQVGGKVRRLCQFCGVGPVRAIGWKGDSSTVRP
jgi:hypothetical protein